MAYFVLKRLRQGILSLAGIVLLVFVLARLTGSPARLYLPEEATQEIVDAFNAAHGFDGPIIVQLWDYILGVLTLNFGESIMYGQPALDVVMSRYGATLALAAWTMLFAVVLGIIFGVASASRPGSFRDGLTRVGSLTALSVPDFWVAIMGITVFSVALGILPTSGVGGIEYWILPLFVLLLRPLGMLTQVVRNSMLSVLDSDYVRVARAKGVSRQAILYKHALRNAAIPVLTVAGVLAAQVVNGALVIETIFGWPGVGNLMVTSIRGRDFAVIQTVVLVTGAAIILLNLMIDIVYSWINPQIRLEA